MRKRHDSHFRLLRIDLLILAFTEIGEGFLLSYKFTKVNLINEMKVKCTLISDHKTKIVRNVTVLSLIKYII